MPCHRPARCGCPRCFCRTARCQAWAARSLWRGWRRSSTTGAALSMGWLHCMLGAAQGWHTLRCALLAAFRARRAVTARQYGDTGSANRCGSLASPFRLESRCAICGLTDGAVMGCQQPGGCHTNFHVLCARNIGLYLSEWAEFGAAKPGSLLGLPAWLTRSRIQGAVHVLLGLGALCRLARAHGAAVQGQQSCSRPCSPSAVQPCLTAGSSPAPSRSDPARSLPQECGAVPHLLCPAQRGAAGKSQQGCGSLGAGSQEPRPALGCFTVPLAFPGASCW